MYNRKLLKMNMYFWLLPTANESLFLVQFLYFLFFGQNILSIFYIHCMVILLSDWHIYRTVEWVPDIGIYECLARDKQTRWTYANVERCEYANSMLVHAFSLSFSLAYAPRAVYTVRCPYTLHAAYASTAKGCHKQMVRSHWLITCWTCPTPYVYVVVLC